MLIRFYLSLIVAKILYLFLKITKLSSGTAILGLISLKICPEFLKFANLNFTNKKINISGTNGKTTTSGILSHILKYNNKTLIHNSLGANMLNGIVNTLALEINPFKKVEYSILETDEAFLEIVYNKMDSDYLLVTNLFEDQTDRFSSPLFTKSLIQRAIDKKPNIQLILNADEPISASLKSQNYNPIFYGIEKVIDEQDNIVEYFSSEFLCPICNENLNYSKNFYSQLGHYTCSCGYKRPEVKYSASVKLFKNYSIIRLADEEFKIPLVGLFNAYNALGAIALAKELNISNIQDCLNSFKVAFGRSEKRILNGHETLIQLIKNPTGANEALRHIDLASNILIAINDNYADGRDISWIDQTNFEKLASVNKEVVVSGLRCDDMAERIKKAGVKNIKTIPNINNAVKYIAENAEKDITILTTYTALLQIDKIKEMKKCF